MSNIIKFPAIHKSLKNAPEPCAPKAAPKAKGRSIVAGIVMVVWIVTVLVWPILRWVLSFDVLFQFVRMVWNWDTPGAYSGWTFLLHFVVATAITYFVSFHKPKGI